MADRSRATLLAIGRYGVWGRQQFSLYSDSLETISKLVVLFIGDLRPKNGAMTA